MQTSSELIAGTVSATTTAGEKSTKSASHGGGLTITGGIHGTVPGTDR